MNKYEKGNLIKAAFKVPGMQFSTYKMVSDMLPGIAAMNPYDPTTQKINKFKQLRSSLLSTLGDHNSASLTDFRKV